jgi:hypothetical protein
MLCIVFCDRLFDLVLFVILYDLLFDFLEASFRQISRYSILSNAERVI